MTRIIATASRSTSSSPKPDRREFMRLTTFHCAYVAMALASPAMAQQSASLPPGAQPRTDVESAIPLTPGMIRDLGRRVGDNKRAEEEVNTVIASPISRRVNVSFAPGQSTSIIRIVKGYPTALSFFARTGPPWPLEWDTNSNPAGQANNGNCNQGPAGGAGPAVASAGFYVCTPTVGSNVLQVAAGSLQPRGGLLVTLKGAPKPISFMLVAGGGAYDADLTVQVAERGPNAKGVATGPVAPDTASPFLTAMLDGAPPAEAEPLAVAGVSPDDLRAWKVGDRVVLRTRFALISPEWLDSQTGEGGVTVYSLPVTPVVLLSQDGVTVSASLSEP